MAAGIFISHYLEIFMVYSCTGDFVNAVIFIDLLLWLMFCVLFLEIFSILSHQGFVSNFSEIFRYLHFSRLSCLWFIFH